jgi:myosin heavy subunit
MTGFLEKNRDTIHADLMEVLTASEEGMVRALAEAMQVSQAAAVEKAGGLRARAKVGGCNFNSTLKVAPADFGA